MQLGVSFYYESLQNCENVYYFRHICVYVCLQVVNRHPRDGY